MPSQITHLAIAKRYLAKHPHQISAVQRFLDGNVLPDLCQDKSVSHCGTRTEMHDVIKRNLEKVNPQKFLAENNLSDDLNRGQYLHLVTDYEYYNTFLRDYFGTVTMRQSGIDMYETTRRDDDYLIKKYGVGYQDSTYAKELEEINARWDTEHIRRRAQKGYHFVMPYNFDALDEFIEKMSDVEIPD